MCYMDLQSRLFHLRGIIARNAKQRLSDNKMHITAKDINDSMDILHEEVIAGRT